MRSTIPQKRWWTGLAVKPPLSKLACPPEVVAQTLDTDLPNGNHWTTNGALRALIRDGPLGVAAAEALNASAVRLFVGKVFRKGGSRAEHTSDIHKRHGRKWLELQVRRAKL